MKILSFAGFPMDSTYNVIKAISKKRIDKITKIKPQFIEGFKKRVLEDDGVDEHTAEQSAITAWHIIEDSSAYTFNASHSVAVALDGLYCAYIKGNYPMAFYKALLTIYQDRKDKDKIAAAKDEMLKGFGIKMVPCRFRQDNRNFLVNEESRTVSDALSSMKGVSVTVADTLYAARNKKFDTFIDVLHWMTTQTRINAAVQATLILTDYFIEFGDKRKLIMLHEEFHNGEGKFSKSHVPATQTLRLDALREKENELKCLELEKMGIIDVAEQLRFETNVWGAPLSTYEDYGLLYTAVEVNDKTRTPTIHFYSARSGTIGKMRVRKPMLEKMPIEKGDSIFVGRFNRRNAGRYINGGFQPDGTTEIWLDSYQYVVPKTDDAAEGAIKE